MQVGPGPAGATAGGVRAGLISLIRLAVSAGFGGLAVLGGFRRVGRPAGLVGSAGSVGLIGRVVGWAGHAVCPGSARTLV